MNIRYLITLGLLALGGLLAFGQTNIIDIQRVDPQGSSGASPLLGQTVRVRGVVTASAEEGSLGFIYVQQEGEDEWAGIRVYSGASAELTRFMVGYRVVITGQVSERDGRTSLDNVVIDSIHGMGTIEPVELDPALFTNYSLPDNEQYENMLVRLAVDGELIRVVDENTDGPVNNFGEWRLGTIAADSNLGCRVLTGRVTSSVFSSLSVSYINDISWATNNGRLTVDPVVITTDTAFESVTGLIEYSFGNFKLLPRNNDDFVLRGGTVSTNNQPGVIRQSRLFPNPVSTSVSIELTLAKSSRLSVELYDSRGALVHQLVSAQMFRNGVNTIPLPSLTDLPSGGYFLRAVGPEGMAILQMHKQ